MITLRFVLLHRHSFLPYVSGVGLAILLTCFPLRPEALTARAESPQEPLHKAGTALSQGHYKEAVRLYQKALQTNPQDPYALLGLGQALQAQGNIAEAQAQLERLIALHPNFAQAYYNLGLILESKGDLATARRAFQQYVEKSQGQIPSTPEVRLKLRQMGVY